MSEGTGQDHPYVVVATDDESLRLQLRASEQRGLLSPRGAARLVVDVSDLGQLTSATIAELLSVARRTGGRVLVRGGSKDSVRVLGRAGLPVDRRHDRAAPRTRTQVRR